MSEPTINSVKYYVEWSKPVGNSSWTRLPQEFETRREAICKSLIFETQNPGLVTRVELAVQRVD